MWVLKAYSSIVLNSSQVPESPQKNHYCAYSLVAQARISPKGSRDCLNLKLSWVRDMCSPHTHI